MSDEKIYCGISKVPKGYRLGTAKECLNKGQVRYYGLEKIDLVTIKKNTVNATKLRNAETKLLILKAKGKKLKEEIQYAKTEKEKTKLTKKYDKLEQKFKADFEKYKEMKDIFDKTH